MQPRTHWLYSHAATVIAALAMLFASANAATVSGVTYTYDANPPNDARYPDTGFVELTDGILATSGGFGNAAFAGFNSIEPVITFDLGSTYQIDNIDFQYGEGTRWSPSQIHVSSSVDGISYSSAETFVVGNGPSSLVTVNLDVSPLPSGRYYQITVERASQWLFLSEVTFDAVPEPNSLTLLGLGGLGFCLRRRRQPAA